MLTWFQQIIAHYDMEIYHSYPNKAKSTAELPTNYQTVSTSLPSSGIFPATFTLISMKLAAHKIDVIELY